jgi:integrase
LDQALSGRYSFNHFCEEKEIQMTKRRGNHEGTIVRLPSGTYRALITLDGKRVTHTGKTRAECQGWIRKMLDQIDEGLTFKGTQTTLDEFLKDWLVTAKTALRPKPAQQYEKLIENHIVPVIGKVKMKDLRPDTIDSLYRNRIKAVIGVRTIRYCHAVLHVALEKAVRLGLLTRNPVDGATPPRNDQGEMLILDEEQVIQFLIAARGTRHEALFHIAVKTGMRQAELLGLKWADLSWTTGQLQVRRQAQRSPGKGYIFCEPKTKAGRRTIPLGEASLNVLRQHLEKQRLLKQVAGARWKESDLIFPSNVGTPIDLCNLRKEFVRVLRIAGLPEIRFHDLRHTAASIMLKRNIPIFTVSRVLGHSRPSITLDIYAHMIPGMQDMVAKIMDEAITPIPVGVESEDVEEILAEMDDDDDL